MTIMVNATQLNLSNLSDLQRKDATFVYKIGLVGPTQIGKTTTITALLQDANELLATTGVKLEPRGKLTEKRLARNYSTLNGSLLAGEFHPGTLEGTQDSFVFHLAMTAYGSLSELMLAILDYPGGWLTDPPAGQGSGDWQACKDWLNNSTVLIVPIDATVVMSAKNAAEQAAVLQTLGIFQTIALARDWARSRFEQQESGLLLLVPVKCESYFNDNGGDRDRSEELFQRVMRLYCDLIDGVKQELPPSQCTIRYHPIDTIGCVELKSGRWVKTRSGDLNFEADYQVRPPARRCTCGVGGLLVAICKQIYQGRRTQGGLLNQLWLWLTGDNKRIMDAIEKLNHLPDHPRVRQIP